MFQVHLEKGYTKGIFKNAFVKFIDQTEAS